MVYGKQNFVNGQKLEAKHLNTIEDGIVNVHRFLTGEKTVFSQSVAASLEGDCFISPAPFTLTEDNTYKVSVDGVESEVVCRKGTWEETTSLILGVSLMFTIVYQTPEVSGVDGGKVIFVSLDDTATSYTVEIIEFPTNGKILQIENGEAQWVEFSGESSGVPGGSAEIPVFDLGAMGLTAISLPAGNSSLEADTVAIISALEAGAVRFVIPVSMDGNTITFSVDMHGFTDGTGYYQCNATAMLDVPITAMVILVDGGIQVTVAPLTMAIGFPSVTEADNGKIMQVVDGAWSSVPVAESAVKTYVDDYISSALEGDY